MTWRGDFLAPWSIRERPPPMRPRWWAVALVTLGMLLVADVGLLGVRALVERPSRVGPAPEVAGPAFVAENLAWRNIEHFTMRPGLQHGTEYRMDEYGLRMHWLEGPRHDAAAVDVRMDRHDKLMCRKVWMFGGSTTIGLGLAEADSLPAQLQLALNAGTLTPTGKPAWCVFNLGMGSQEAAQEFLLFYELLQRGHRPDLVVFLDGLNESMGGPPGPAPVWDMDSAPIRIMRGSSTWASVRAVVSQRSGLLWAVRRARGGPSRPTPSPQDADRMIARYTVTVALLRGMTEAVGARSLFAWQPALAYQTLQPQEGREGEAAMWSIAGNPADAERHRAFLRHRPAGVHDLTGVFDGVTGAVWMDPRHPNSVATRLIADRLAPLVMEALK